MNKSVSDIYIYALDSWPTVMTYIYARQWRYLHLLTTYTRPGGAAHFLFISAPRQIVISQGDCRRGCNDVCVTQLFLSEAQPP